MNHPRLSEETNIHPTRRQLPTWKRYLHMIDIFAFFPSPRTDPVSTRRSLCGSFLLFSMFLAYIIFSFVDFLRNNVPKTTQSTEVIDNSIYDLPSMAIAFFWGEPFSETINDPTILTITMQQVTKDQDIGQDEKKVEVPLFSCRPDWIPKMGFDMLCPSKEIVAQGLLYSTPMFQYPRFSINYCNSQKSQDCVSDDELAVKAAGGRLILYVKNDNSKAQEVLQYQTFQFFLVPGIYNRAQVIFQKQTYTSTPNFLTSFTDKVNTYLSVQQEVFYLTNTTIFDNGSHGFQIWFRLSQNQLLVDIVYVTVIDMVAKWGAFWGVLFAAFAFYFLRFNEKRFYMKNPDWEKFDNKLIQIEEDKSSKYFDYTYQIEEIK